MMEKIIKNWRTFTIIFKMQIYSAFILALSKYAECFVSVILYK